MWEVLQNIIGRFCQAFGGGGKLRSKVHIFFERGGRRKAGEGDELCSRPTYALVSRVQGCRDGEDVDCRLDGPVIRAAVDASALQIIVREVQFHSRGEAFVCTTSGSVVAAADMADQLNVEKSTGQIRASYIWELAREWAPVIETEKDFLKNTPRDGVLSGGYRVTSWKLGGLRNSTPELDDELRMVLAVPGNAFVDPILGPFVIPGLATAAAPFVIVLLVAIRSVYRIVLTDMPATIVSPERHAHMHEEASSPVVATTAVKGPSSPPGSPDGGLFKKNLLSMAQTRMMLDDGQLDAASPLTRKRTLAVRGSVVVAY